MDPVTLLCSIRGTGLTGATLTQGQQKLHRPLGPLLNTEALWVFTNLVKCHRGLITDLFLPRGCVSRALHNCRRFPGSTLPPKTTSFLISSVGPALLLVLLGVEVLQNFHLFHILFCAFALCNFLWKQQLKEIGEQGLFYLGSNRPPQPRVQEEARVEEGWNNFVQSCPFTEEVKWLQSSWGVAQVKLMLNGVFGHSCVIINIKSG